MDVKKKLANTAHSIAFFIHRSRVQKLYRSFLRVCQDPQERLQVREEFRGDKRMTGADLKEAEAILKRLQIARGISHHQTKLITPVGRSPVRPNHQSTSSAKSSSNDDIPEEIKKASASFEEADRPVEWPWQRRS